MSQKRKPKISCHARVRLEERVGMPASYPTWKEYCTAARTKGKKLQDLEPNERNMWQKYHGKPNNRIPYFFDGKCFIFDKNSGKYTLITVFKHKIKEN